MGEYRRSGKRTTALAALAAGARYREAAKQAGCAESTLRRWLGDAAFRAALDAAQGELVESAVSKLSASATEAAEELARLATHAVDERTRVRASIAVLEVGQRLREGTLIEQRLAALEAALANRGAQ